jgi:oligopeptide transport system substrate-binding protein
LNESGQGDLPSQFLTAVAEMWRQNLGIKAQIRQLDSTNYTRAARAQHGNVVSYGWCADYPDPENFLDILFHTGGDCNVSGYSNPQVDAWLEAARTETDPAKRLALYHQVESTLLGDFALIPWINHLFNVLVKPYVKGYVEPPMDTAVIPLLSLDYGASN